jgi:hypothetical protein
MILDQSLIQDIKLSSFSSKEKAIRAVDHERTIMYWHIGRRIFEEEQQGKDRADYGNYLTKFISEQLEPEFGVVSLEDKLSFSDSFTGTFPIANTLYSQLS